MPQSVAVLDWRPVCMLRHGMWALDVHDTQQLWEGGPADEVSSPSVLVFGGCRFGGGDRRLQQQRHYWQLQRQLEQVTDLDRGLAVADRRLLRRWPGVPARL